jgi:hypothetical protein
MRLPAPTQGDPHPMGDPCPPSPERQQDPSTLPFAEKRERFKVLSNKAQAQQTTPLLKAPAPARSAPQRAPASAPTPALQRTAAAPSGNGSISGIFRRRSHSARSTSVRSTGGAPEAYLPYEIAATGLLSHPISSLFTTDSEGSQSSSPTLAVSGLAAAATASESPFGNPPLLSPTSSGSGNLPSE